MQRMFISPTLEAFFCGVQVCRASFKTPHREGEPPTAESLQNALVTCWLLQKKNKKQAEETKPQLTAIPTLLLWGIKRNN